MSLVCNETLGYFELNMHLGLCMTAFYFYFLTYHQLHAAIIPSKMPLCALSPTQMMRNSNILSCFLVCMFCFKHYPTV